MVECNDAPAEGWADYARAHGEFYHDPRWVTALAQAFGYPLHCLTVRGADGIAGVLALAEVPGLLGPRRLVSLPFSYAAGPLAASANDRQALLAAAIARAEAVGISRVEVKQLVDVAPEPAPAYIRRTRYATYRVDLSGGEAAVFGRLHADSTRRGIRKAEKSGVTVQHGSSAADWTRMAELEEETARTHGIPAPPREFFTRTCVGLQQAGLADLYLAVAAQAAEPLAGIVTWKGPRRWIYAFGASRPAALSLRPNHALLWRAMREAIAAGVSFDLGRAAPEQEGLVEFKLRWGGVASPLAYDYWPLAGGLNTGDRSRGPLAAAARIWSRLPRPITRLGARLYRYMG